MEVQLPVDEIRTRLRKRQKTIRGWLTPGSHALLEGRVRSAHQALGAMVGILESIAPALSKLLAEREAALDLEQAARVAYAQESKLAARTYREWAQEFREVGDTVEADIWEAEADRSERAAKEVPDLTQWSRSLWNLGALTTAGALFNAADEISRSRDLEALKHMGVKSGKTLGKWLLKLTPIRKEDIEDIVEVWQALMKIFTVGKDITEVLESPKMRMAQVKTATLLLDRLDVIEGIATEWCRIALAHPFLSTAMGIDRTSQPALDAALAGRLDKAARDWEDPALN